MITFTDDYVVGNRDTLRACQALAIKHRMEDTKMTRIEDVKNPIQQFETVSRRIGLGNDYMSKCVAQFIKIRGPVGEGPYACTCSNWGPRWIENSANGCCPGCWQWALDHHQETDVNGVDPVTMPMIEKSTWGFNVAKIKENKAHKELHVVAENYLSGPLTWEKTQALKELVDNM